jgi:cytoskeletal protein RodZ
MAPQVGQALREARTERGVELSEVERVTKIRVKFLEAMEDDRWDELPAPAYARGFLSIYARYLGLDEGVLLDRYRTTVERADTAEPIPSGVVQSGQLRRNRSRRPKKPVAILIAGLVAVVALALVIVGSIGGSGDGGKAAKDHGEKSAGPTPAKTTTSTTPTTSTPASGVSVELRATADVWVCLVTDQGDPVVNSETLAADETRGPFEGSAFDVTFGNGSVELTVDGEPAKVPSLAEPLGYRITPSGVRPLDPSAQPTCQ